MEKQNEYSYCIHCERAQESKKKGGCIYFDCDGAPFDLWSWDFIAKENNYPEIPENNKKYPMYPN